MSQHCPSCGAQLQLADMNCPDCGATQKSMTRAQVFLIGLVVAAFVVVLIVKLRTSGR